MEEGMWKSLLLLTFSISESDSNVCSLIHLLLETHDVLQEHTETFKTIETQDAYDSVDTVCIKECQSNVCRSRGK
jgi:hypothetical protein